MEKDGESTPTGFGFLVFGKQPRTVIPQAGLLGTIHYPSGEEETHDFNDPIVLISGLVEEWSKSELSSTIDRSRMAREERPALPSYHDIFRDRLSR